MKAIIQTVTDLSKALQKLDPQGAFQSSVQRLTDQKETTLEALSQKQQVETHFIKPFEAALRVKTGNLDE
ncbi:MAG: hypothetical protein AAFQ10_06810 [Pseudomonadota bacterium]